MAADAHRWQICASLLALAVSAGTACSATPGLAVAAQSTSQGYQPPRLRQPLPVDDYQGSREGRIHVELDVSATGEVTAARIAPGGFGQKQFAARALRRARAAKFEPARQDGAPVAVRGHVMVQSFMQLQSSTSLAGVLKSRLDKAAQLIGSGDLRAAHAFLEKVLSDDVASPLDYAELQRRAAMAYSAVGEITESGEPDRAVFR